MNLKVRISIFLIILFISCKKKQEEFPLFIQHNSVSCGPTCLKMIFKYYGKEIEVDTISKIAKQNSSGTNLFDLGETANHFGFKSLGVKLNYEELKEISLPAILFWEKNHFVVLYKIENDLLFIADPAIGRSIKYSKQSFCNYWYQTNNESLRTGIALLIVE